MSDGGLLVFGGTYEGRAICECLKALGVKFTASVATQYGKDMLDSGADVLSGRMDEQAIYDFITQKGFACVIDATHPYASEAAMNVQSACGRARIEYIPVEREETAWEAAHAAEDMRGAVEFLKNTHGKVLVTTGSKELHRFTALEDYKERVIARVLPCKESLDICESLGIPARHIICMHGPFSLEMNLATLRQYDCRFLVTKSTGMPGGMAEKLAAAAQAGASVVVVRRRGDKTGEQTLDSILALLRARFDLCRHTHFPAFIPMTGARALIVGGGEVALRRLKTLLRFTCEITLVSPRARADIEELIEARGVCFKRREFEATDIEGVHIVVAATDRRDVNRMIGELAREKGQLVSVADVKEECGFFFPAIVESGNIVAGISSGGGDHQGVAELARRIREVLGT